MWNPSTCDCECNEAYKVDDYIYIENCSCQKLLIGKLVLTCEDDTIETNSW